MWRPKVDGAPTCNVTQRRSIRTDTRTNPRPLPTPNTDIPTKREGRVSQLVSEPMTTPAISQQELESWLWGAADITSRRPQDAHGPSKSLGCQRATTGRRTVRPRIRLRESELLNGPQESLETDPGHPPYAPSRGVSFRCTCLPLWLCHPPNEWACGASPSHCSAALK